MSPIKVRIFIALNPAPAEHTAGGKTFSITLSDPREDLLKAEAETVMDTIIQKNIIFTPSGALTGKQDIRVIDTTINDLYDPPQI